MPKDITTTLYRKIRGSWMLLSILCASMVTAIILDTILQQSLIIGLTDPTYFSLQEWARITFRLIISWTIAIVAWLALIVPILIMAPLFKQ